MTGGCHFCNLRHFCGDSFHALRSPGVSGVEMKICKGWLQALLSSAPHSRVLARLALLAQIARSREARFACPNRPLTRAFSRGSLRLPKSRVLARLASLAQIGELARRLNFMGLQNYENPLLTLEQ